MTKDYDPELVARRLEEEFSLDVQFVAAALKKIDGMQPFYFVTARLLTTDEIVSMCRAMAASIRRDIPERQDGWAFLICPGNRPLRPMGAYYVGWAGRPDEWDLKEGEERKATDHTDWLAFRSRLQTTVAAIGTEGERDDEGGDFKVYELEDSPLRQTLFVNNPEFLTKELIAAIQNLLRDGPANGAVEIITDFVEPFDTLWKAVEIRADSVEELWDRQEAEQILGDRLKSEPDCTTSTTPYSSTIRGK